MEWKVRDSCGNRNSESKGDPTGASAPRRLPTAHGKRVPTFQSTSNLYKPKKM
ncbi:hypothetical protein KEH51_03535 [[Brevibacterium] frigoritolerans]|uniref:Uncharacterized protein n=1 Tax=Peribacillus frigoritolerans TaxID=450367 RepID=A0A941FG03_9BACI|nr:hypothetical protein [Peribacillus frigoritolerans]